MDDENQKLELHIQGKMKWGEYKKIASDKTDFDTRAALIEKHIQVVGGEIDDVPFEDVIAALQKMTQAQAKN